MRKFARILLLACAVGACSEDILMAQKPHKVDRDAVLQLYVAADRSQSTGFLNPPETSQTVIHHVLELASLANQPIEVCIVTYGADGVQVIGDENGRPTAAYESLEQKLFAEWPKGDGPTPMDEAFAKLVELIRDGDGSAQAVIVHISDGAPQSGRLRPDDFTEISDSIKKGREAVIARGCRFPPTVQQELLRQFEEPLRDPTTEEYLELYDRQIPLELKRTIRHAGELKRLGARMVTIDFVGVPSLTEIHEAAGGRPLDLLRVAPNEVIDALHKTRITELPGVVQAADILVAADENSFDKTIDIPIDSVGEEAVVAIEFRPAVGDLFKLSQLSARVLGREVSFDPVDGEPETSATYDAHGNVATASLRLSDVPQSGIVQIAWNSSDGSLSLPDMQIHTFLRLRDSLQADFRPSFVAEQDDGPFAISSTHETDYVFRLRDRDANELIPLAEAEVVLRHHINPALKQRLRLTADPRFPEQVISDKVKLPAGTYDAELHIRLKSGVQFSMVLRDHLKIETKDEFLQMEIPLDGDRPELISPLHSHNEFGPIGDSVTKVSRQFLIRSANIEYPLQVRLSAAITDSDGVTPEESWIKFSPEVVTFQQGKVQKVTCTLALPKEIEGAIVDGTFDGAIVATVSDTGQTIPIRRLQPVSGVPDDAPVELLSFELKRPRISAAAPYALRNWIKEGRSGGLETTVRVDIDQEFGRVVTLDIGHDSSIERTLTVTPSGLVHDRQNHAVPQLRLLPLPDTEATQTIAEGQNAQWKFRFEIDDDCDILRAETGLDIYGDGIVPEHITVKIQRADPLLAGWIRLSCWCIAGALVFVFAKNILPLLRLKQFCTGSISYVSAGAKRIGLFAVGKLHRNRLQLIPLIPMESTGSATRRARPVAADRIITVKPESVSPSTPLAFTVPSKTPAVIHITDVCENADGQPEVCVEVRDGGAFDIAHHDISRRMKRCVVWTVVCVALICTLNHPVVLASAQWVHDAIFFV